MKFKIVIILSVVFVGISACYKTPTFSIIPTLTFNRFEKTSTIYRLGDTGSLFLDFTDGDGDLGKLNNQDSIKNIFIKTPKYINKLDTFILPNIPQKGTTKAISGTIGINLTSLLDPNSFPILFRSKGITQDTLQFEIYIKDRANHQSNTITTTPLVVHL